MTNDLRNRIADIGSDMVDRLTDREDAIDAMDIRYQAAAQILSGRRSAPLREQGRRTAEPLLSAVMALLDTAEIGRDNNGQIVIYTGLEWDNSGRYLDEYDAS